MRSPAWRWLLVAALALALTLLAVALVPPTAHLGQGDQVAIYATVVRHLCTHDDSFGGTYQPAVVYLLRQTNDAAGDPAAPHGIEVVLPEAAQEGVAAALADLPARLVWVDSAAAVSRDANTGEVAGRGVMITLGNIYLFAGRRHGARPGQHLRRQPRRHRPDLRAPEGGWCLGGQGQHWRAVDKLSYHTTS